MFIRVIPAVILSMLALPVLAQTDPVATAGSDQTVAAASQETEPEAIPEKILVVGQRPGPGLWKVSKGEHVMWVFGTYSPLPKKMEWRSHQVEAILAESQEFLSPPSAKLGVLQVLPALPFAIGLNKNPDGAYLKDVLPPDVYARWLPLKEKYLGRNDGIERLRPIFAGEQLLNAALFQAGLSSRQEASDTIYELAKKHKLKMTTPKVEMAIESPIRAVRAFKKSSLEDVACFTKTLDRLETDIDAMRIRANAWAKGDLEEIRKLDYVGRDEACHSAMMSSPVMKGEPAFQTMEARGHSAWMAAAEKSLATNTSTFAILPIKRILDPNGVIADLKARGYEVESPD